MTAEFQVKGHDLFAQAYRSDVSDEKLALVAPCLTLLREDVGQRQQSLRKVFNGLRYFVNTGRRGA